MFVVHTQIEKRKCVIDERSDGQIFEWTDGPTDGRTNGLMNGRTDGWTMGLTDGCMDGQTLT